MAEPPEAEWTPPPIRLLQSESISSDIPFGKHTTTQGVLFVSDSSGTVPPRQYWMAHTSTWNSACRHFYIHSGYDTFHFLPYSKRSAFVQFYPGVPLDPVDIIVQEERPPNVRPSEVSHSPLRPGIHRPPPPYKSPFAQRTSPLTTTQQQGNPLQPEDDTDARLEQLRREADDKRRRLDEIKALQEESSRLDAEIAAATAQAPATAPATFTGTTSTDANTALLQALTRALLAQQETKAPTMPTWNGEDSTKRFFFEEIQAFKEHKYFASVTDWSRADNAHQDHSLHLRKELLRTIPPAFRPTYTEEPRFYDGFVFFEHYLQSINQDGPIQQLMHLVNFATYQVGSKSRQEILSDTRHMHLGLRHMTIDSLLSMRLIQSFKEEGRYEGIVASFTSGDPKVVGCDLDSLSGLMEREDALSKFIDPQAQLPAAKRGAAKPPEHEPKPPAMQVSYPPTSGIQWKTLQDLVSAKQQCPFCFSRVSFHTEEGCPALAQLNLVLVEDADKARELLDKYAKNKNERNQRRGRGGAGKGGGRTPADGRGRGGRSGRGQGNARRATSGERKQPDPETDTSASNRYAALDDTRNTYVDQEEIESDYSDGADIDVDFSSAEQTNPNTKSTDYSTPAKARKAKANNVSKVLSTIASSSLSKHQHSISKTIPNSLQCCADSGATDHMFPDYSAFTSYKRTPNSYIQLGDGTKLQQKGIGSVKIRLNGKVILLRNVLHVPALQEPLYSLRRHSELPGCGYYSSYETGSHLLFPTFVLKVDTSVDNILSYESIGSRTSPPINYYEPREGDPLARMAHLIPPDEPPPPPPINEMNQVRFNYMPPKSSTITPAKPPMSPPPQSPDTSTPAPDSEVITDTELLENSRKPLETSDLTKLHDDPSTLPPVPPAYTPGPAEHRTTFDPLKLHKFFGCRRFRNQQHLIAASSNAKLIKQGELPSTIGDFVTINQPNKGKPIQKHRKYLDKVHMDIVFGDCLSLGNYRYALLLVDVATRYCWLYGMQALTSNEIISCLVQFQVAAGGTPKTYHSDFDQKLIGGKARRWILESKSRIIAAPAHRQSSNGLVERTWQSIVRMARAYITEKQVGREFWFYAIKHAAHMINQVPGRLGRKLTSPFELVHGVKPDSSTWFELFSVGYFKHESEGGEAKSKTQAQTLDGIAVGRDEQSNTILFYNPLTKQYYRPPVFKLDEGRLPISCFPKSVRFDGGLTCGPIRNRTDPAPEPFPPGTRVTIDYKGSPTKGTVANVPLPFLSTTATAADDNSDNDDTEPGQSTTYVINLDNGETTECDFAHLAPQAPNSPHDSITSATTDPFQSLPHIFKRHSKVTIDHNGAFHKGYLDHTPEGGFRFVAKRNATAKTILWSVPLPDFGREWYTMVAEDLIIPGHGTVSTYLRPNSSNNAPSAKHVSAKNLINPCPPSLAKALHPSNPDRDVWLASYREEKGGLKALDVYDKISKKRYLQLRRSGHIGKALPSMCVLVVKHDKDGNPVRAKSRIVVLGNHEDRVYEKSQRYAPVLKYSSLRLLVAKAVRAKKTLQQGDCKNAFCNATLPDDELTVVMPPQGDPANEKDEFWLLKKTLYGLRRSPHHWYNMFTAMLKNIGLTPSPHDPCLFSGVVQSADISTDIPPSQRKPIHVGIYVDDFVFFSEDSREEELFKQALSNCTVPIDWMGTVSYFLGTAFDWQRHADGHLSVLLSQSAFVEYSAHRFSIDRCAQVPNMTPYRSGMPIDSIPPPAANDPDQKRRTKCYQAVVGCINWLATCTRPDVAPALTFLASYNTNPSAQHYKSALHVLKYLHSTSEYGISFHSNAHNNIQAFNHFPHHHDKEAYSDATRPPSPASCINLTAFSDACWGGQFGNAVPDGTPLELFKFRSLSGYLICCAGGPIAWKAIRQEQTANSSCVAEINATHECVNDLLSIKHRALDLGFPDAAQTITVYNDNKAAVDWAASVTLKGTKHKHINLHENCVRENHQNGTVAIKHIPGVINASDLFTKELKDAAHFRRCRDSFMVSRANFLKFGHCVPPHKASLEDLPYYSIRMTGSPESFRQTLAPSAARARTVKQNSPAPSQFRFRLPWTVSDRPSNSRSERGVSLPHVRQPRRFSNFELGSPVCQSLLAVVL